MKPSRIAVELDELIAAGYPQETTIGEWSDITLAPMVPSDWQFLERFLRDTPHQERRFFRHEASDPALVERWCSELDYRHILPLLAWRGDRIIADGILHREPGLWTSHVGRLRLLVHPDYRRAGVGTQIIQNLIGVADGLGLHKLLYECAEGQVELISFLERVGFKQAAYLPEFIRDCDGQFHDMVLMVYPLRG